MEPVYFCYLMTHKQSGIMYYGSKTAKNSHPSMLGCTYFSSSKIVQSILKQEGKDAFAYEIRKTFSDKTACLKWEQKVLQRMLVRTNPKFFNIDQQQDRTKAVHLRTKTTFIYNRDLDIMVRWPITKPIPANYVIGKRPISRPTDVDKRWYYNPTDPSRRTHSLLKPDGWLEGRGPNYIGNSKSIKEKNQRWFTDGVNNVLCVPSACPDDWKSGRTIGSRPKDKITSGFRHITDGTHRKRISPTDTVPTGWRYGIPDSIIKAMR